MTELTGGDITAILFMAIFMLMASAGHMDIDEIKAITTGEYDE